MKSLVWLNPFHYEDTDHTPSALVLVVSLLFYITGMLVSTVLFIQQLWDFTSLRGMIVVAILAYLANIVSFVVIKLRDTTP